MKMHEKVANYIENIIDSDLGEYVHKDLNDIEVRHELIRKALDALYGSDKIERLAEQMQEDLIDNVDCTLEVIDFWERLENIVMCMAEDVEEPTYHVEDHRRDVL